MGSVAIKPSHAVGRLLRQRRREFNLSLNSVSKRLEKRGHRIPPSTLGRIEQGKLDPGVRRLHLLLDLYQVPPHLVSDLVELETIADRPPEVVREADLQALHDQGIEYWKKGDVAQGLAYLLAVREYVPETPEANVLRQQTTLAFATAARNLGKYRLARQMIDELLCEPPAPPVLVPALVLAASLWRGVGALDVALGMIGQAEKRLEESQLKERGWVLHQKARLLLDAGETGESDKTLKQAVRIYRQRKDSYGEVRAMVLRVAILEAMGDDRRARETARDVIRVSESKQHARGVVYGHLVVGRLLVKDGQLEPGIEQLTQAHIGAVRAKDSNAEFLAHYHLWKAYQAAGDHDRAGVELENARYFVRFVDEHTAAVEEIKGIQEGGNR